MAPRALARSHEWRVDGRRDASNHLHRNKIQPALVGHNMVPQTVTSGHHLAPDKPDDQANQTDHPAEKRPSKLEIPHDCHEHLERV